eukprot:Awhi_evm1s1069
MQCSNPHNRQPRTLSAIGFDGDSDGDSDGGGDPHKKTHGEGDETAFVDPVPEPYDYLNPQEGGQDPLPASTDHLLDDNGGGGGGGGGGNESE